MIGNERNFSLSLWDHKDNFICLLKSSNSNIEGQSYNEYFTENITGEKTLTFSIPMYIFNPENNQKFEKNKSLWEYKNNILWEYIKNEQKIRYTEYDDILNTPIRIEEFVLKEFTEERNGEEKIANCTCESLAVYELGKVGWGISFDTDYVLNYEYSLNEEQENNDLLTLDYWLKKIFYKESNLGRVSTTTECTYLLQGLQLRDDEGFPIENTYIGTSTGEFEYKRLEEEPSCTTEDSEEFQKYYNPTGWYWEVQAIDPRILDKEVKVNILYEKPIIDKYVETVPNYYEPYNYQVKKSSTKLKEWKTNIDYVHDDYVIVNNKIYKCILPRYSFQSYSYLPSNPSQDSETWIEVNELYDDSKKELLPYPISKENYDKIRYVTDIKRRLFTIERSNIFSIIQDLCEIFEIWAYFQYEYSSDGKIIGRKILFKTESIDENIKFDFSYGKNLQSCSRIINSNDLVTKLIVPPVESSLRDGNLLSIQQSSANPTGENYIYNFDYFYNELGTFTKEESLSTESDEYKIKLHCGNLRKINDKILNIQKFLTPLYDKQSSLESELIVQEGAKTGYMDNIQSIRDKIDAIPPEDQVIESWTKDNLQYSHVGPIKTYSTTTYIDGKEYLYLNFGRDDILVKSFSTNIEDYSENNNEINSITTKSFNLPGFIPRSFNYSQWHTGDNIVEESVTTPVFTLFEESNDPEDIVKYIYSDLGNECFIKGILFNEDRGTYGRIRYTYAPLAYYYLLIEDYWIRIKEVQDKINILNSQIINIKNQILIYELDLKNLLNNKRELILQFEKNYKPFIREGYWEPTDYQAQIDYKQFDTSNIISNYDGLFTRNYKLSDLNLNDSLNKYTYYIELEDLSEIDLNSIEMKTETTISGNDGKVKVPRYRGHDFEFYKKAGSGVDSLIIAISPELINKIDSRLINQDEKKCYLTYKKNESITTELIEWNSLSSLESPLIVSDYSIYISNDNILTDSLEVYKGVKSESTKLEIYNDYTYTFEPTAYCSTSKQRFDISKWDILSTTDLSSTDINNFVYSTTDPIYYDYSLKIDLKLTNNTSQYLKFKKPPFIVCYKEDSTLQYLYNDAVFTSDKYAYPQVEYSVSVVDLSSLNNYKNYKPKIGQKVPIFDSEMGFNGYEGFITSISYNLEQKENTEITIATYSTKFEDVFQKLTAVMSDVSYNSNKIYNAADSFETNGTIKTEVFQRSLDDNFNRISLGTDNDITIDKESGITLKDNNSSNAVKLIGNGIFLTENYDDDQVKWKTGITGKGLNADAITAGNIDTKQINIWNSSEGQIRFRWNEQGLFAYGDSADTNTVEEGGIATSTATTSDLDKIIDYKKYVKFNQDGLNFSDNGKSALSLGWSGLNINTQNNSLVLNSDDGLILNEWVNTTTSVNRLQLGKLDNGHIYGLKLKDTNGKTSFQSDSDGNLWLSNFINIGGSFDDSLSTSSFKPINPTAGIVGITTNNIHYQMGVIRDNSSGDIIFKTTQLRFWAGPQTKSQYLTNLSLTSLDVQKLSEWNNLNDYDPALAKFKVDSEGNIVASGIDVGGWIGAGKILRSKNFEAILRSDSYSTTAPVFAIGQPSSEADTQYGNNYNFRVYQDGSVNITKGNLNLGNGNFIIDNNGNVTIKSGTITIGGFSASSNNTSINGNVTGTVTGTVGGMTANSSGLVFTTTKVENNVTNIYRTAMYARTGDTNLVFEAGLVKSGDTNKDAPFRVNGKGQMYATSGTIGGWNINGTSGINKTSGTNATFIRPNTNNDNPVIYIGTTTSLANYTTSGSTSFAVSGKGAVYFKGGIYGWSNTKNTFKQGYTEGSANSLLTASGQSISIEICQGLIIDIR